MKKILLYISFAMICSTGSAQWLIGFNVGPTMSNYKSKSPWKEVANLGFVAGGSAYRQINTNLGVDINLQYIQKGYYHKICNSIYDKLKANYVEVPIMIDYGFSINALKNFKFHGNLGLYGAYWLSGKYVDKGIGGNGDTFDFKANKASRIDFGPNAGGKIEYLLKSGSIVLNFRYELGLVDMQKKINDNTNNVNRAMVIGFTYLKPIGH